MNDETSCKLCGGRDICQSLGMLRYEVPIEDPRFGKMYRCPNFPVEADTERQARLRKIGNLESYADKTFERFVYEDAQHTTSEQQSLKLAFNASVRFSQNPHGWLVLEGTYGCGKTHLAAAVANERLKHGDVVLFITSPDLLDHLRATFGPDAESDYDETFDRVRNAQLLILDDLGVENPSPWAQEKLFQLLNHRYTMRLPTIITTNQSIDKLDPRIRSRVLDVEHTMRVIITAPDFRSHSLNQTQQLMSSLGLYKDLTFDTFEINGDISTFDVENLRRALQHAAIYANDPKGKWLLLVGRSGTGKTHLAAAVANHRAGHGEEVMFTTVTDLMDYLRETYNNDSDMTFTQRLNKIKNVPLLVMDDLGGESGSAWVRERVLQILDYRYVTRKATIITTCKPIDQIDERIQTRILDDRRCTRFEITATPYAKRRNFRS